MTEQKSDIVKYRNEFNLTNINVMDKIEMEELFICNNPKCKQGFPVVKNKPKIVKCPDCEKGYMIKKTRQIRRFLWMQRICIRM